MEMGECHGGRVGPWYPALLTTLIETRVVGNGSALGRPLADPRPPSVAETEVIFTVRLVALRAALSDAGARSCPVGCLPCQTANEDRVGEARQLHAQASPEALWLKAKSPGTHRSRWPCRSMSS